MANLRLPMFQIRRILQLRQQGYSKRAIAASLALARTTVDHYLTTSEAYFPDMQDALNWQDDQLQRLLTQPTDPSADRLGDLYQRFETFENQLSQPGMTRFHLWAVYKLACPNGLKYTQFCHRYKQWLRTQHTVMHLDHKAGDKLFVDFAGKRLTLVDESSGEETPVEFFVAILGCSQLTYAQAVASQRKDDFITALQNALHYLGGVPAAIVPDNLKAAVSKADRYEPDLNETIQDFAAHYNTCIYPARSRKPRDKSLVEGAVNILYRRIYVPLQEQRFGDLASLNRAIAPLLEAHNQQLFQGKDYSRRQRFESLEAALLAPLPTQPYVRKGYRMARVQANCHVLLQPDRHYYSVPHRLVSQSVKLIYTQQTVEIYHQHERVATHERNAQAHGFSTQRAHLPAQQQWVSQWSPAFFREQASSTGPFVAQAIEQLLSRLEGSEGGYPQQYYRSCAGILALARKVELARLEKACERALHFGTVSYKVIRRILDAELDRLPLKQEAIGSIPVHENIRGAAAYQ